MAQEKCWPNLLDDSPLTVLLHSKNDFDATHAELIKSRFEIEDKDTRKMTQAEFS